MQDSEAVLIMGEESTAHKKRGISKGKSEGFSRPSARSQPGEEGPPRATERREGPTRYLGEWWKRISRPLRKLL